MEFSGFTIMSNDYMLGKSSDYKNLLFIKFDNKIYIEVFDYVSWSIILSFDEFMKNTYLKTYYELSLKAIGKPNIDKNYYESDDPDYIPNYDSNDEDENISMYVDTIYIAEDILTNIKEAKKGNCYYSLNIKRLKNANLSTNTEIDAFFTKYNSLYSYEEENFEENKTIYTSLINKL
jgi:hypothetical protein